MFSFTDFCVQESSCLSEATDDFSCIHELILIRYSTVQGNGFIQSQTIHFLQHKTFLVQYVTTIYKIFNWISL